MMRPNHALQRTRRGASPLQSVRPLRRVAELGSFGGIVLRAMLYSGEAQLGEKWKGST